MTPIDQRVRIMVANCEAASAPDKHTKEVVERAIKKAAIHDVDIISWCEVGDVAVAHLDTRLYTTKQYGRPGMDDPEAGCALSWVEPDIKMTNFEAIVGSAATSEGREVTGSGIRERTIVRALVITQFWDAPFHALHAPPSRAARARLSYLRKALGLGGFAAGDCNFILRALLRLNPVRSRTIRAVGVLAIFVPHRFWVSKPEPINIGSDHKAFIVTVEPRKSRKRRLQQGA